MTSRQDIPIQVSRPVAGRLGDEVSPSPARSWLMAIFIAMLTILSVMDRNIIALFLDQIRTDLAMSEVEASIIYGGAFAITFSLVGLPAGWAVDRMSRRKVMFAGVITWSLATMACGLATGFRSMLAARAAVGAGEAVLAPSAHAIISDSFPPEKRTLPFAFYSMGQKAGAAIALIAGGFLATLFAPQQMFEVVEGLQFKGWQIILFVIAAPGVFFALLIFAFAEPPRATGTDQARQVGYKQYFPHLKRHWRFYFGHHLGFIMAQSVYVAILAWSPAYFTRVFGWSASDVGFKLGVALVAGPLISLPLHGWVCDHLFRRGVRDVHLRYQYVMLPIGVLPLCAGYLASSGGAAIVLLTLGLALIAGSAAATTAALQLSVSSNLRGKAASIWVLSGGLASLVGPTSVALINENLFAASNTIGTSLAIFVVVSLLLAVLLYEFARREFGRIRPDAVP
ncbi:MFS family permease [Sphingobium wenxiniae]|uniref:Putative MFS family arabinose efflux permease n=1 Tax=Sphingobium wenxiniae (strain DSM 21828 / CGMCC 1.7748 / JZ-1) TaxID=595605 RepID=A0A562KAE2_SPHWJ|nr:MFS transporter [Sphingobium wenxiniae]MBB6192575.1 MFS family permease [Sphingobium wenxiniae]TWH92254.1 putative MFS family arabinose efflux permease [Sphingobium wenxiniae]SCW92330.1 Predicted arabinose efflux permease, MFS family [Sphingobium faniae]